MLALRSIFFALLIPGTVTVLIPYLIASSRGPIRIEHWTLWQYLSLLPIIVGTGILIWCIRDFAVAGRGTLAPIDPPKHLVVRGPYRYVRHPMDVGAGSILLGEALLLSSLAVLGYAVAYFAIIYLFVVFYEEPTLRRQFGESYETYCRRVHRWVPCRPI